MTAKRLIVASLAGLSALAQTSGPFAAGTMYVRHAATRRTAETRDTGLAPGSLCDIYIAGLYQPTGSLSPDEIVTFLFRAPGAEDTRELTILAMQPNFGDSPTQFKALIPYDTALGKAEVLAVAASGKSFSTTVWIAASGFGLFTKTGAGYDAAAAQIWRNTPSMVGLTTPVQAGEWVTLWGTGLGSTASKVLVEVAGIGVAPSYSGPSPGLTGVDQISFQFPAGVPDDCYIPLTVKVDARESNTTSIAVANSGGPCHHRLGLSPDALATLDQGGFVPLSQSSVQSVVFPSLSTPVTYRRSDAVSLEFFQYGAANVQAFTGLLTTNVSGCQLNIVGGVVGGSVYGNVGNAFFIDAGTPVVTGPGGVRIMMMDSFPGHYSTAPADKSYALDSLPPSSFAPGDWAVESLGGINISAFQAPLRVPPALRWINRATVSPVSRTSDLTLRWESSGYIDKEWIEGSVRVDFNSVTCQAPATAGFIAIPASLIAQLPAPTFFPPRVQLLLTPTDSNPVVYSLPLVGGGAIPGLATFSYLEQVMVELK